MSISDRLAEITARAESASEGPWITKTRYGFTYVPRVIVATQRKVPELVRIEHNGHGAYVPKSVAGVEFVGSDEDAEFIAASRVDVPWLVEQVRKRDTALQAVLAYVDHCEGDYLMHADDIREAIDAALGEES